MSQATAAAKPPPAVPDGSRVRVSIKHPENYSNGAAEALNGLLGVVTRTNPKSMYGQPSPGPACQVLFDKSVPCWWDAGAPAVPTHWIAETDVEILPRGSDGPWSVWTLGGADVEYPSEEAARAAYAKHEEWDRLHGGAAELRRNGLRVAGYNHRAEND